MSSHMVSNSSESEHLIYSISSFKQVKEHCYRHYQQLDKSLFVSVNNVYDAELLIGNSNWLYLSYLTFNLLLWSHYLYYKDRYNHAVFHTYQL